MRHGWTAIDLGDTDELEQLQKLFNSLEAEIIAVIEATDALKGSPDYELYHISEQEPEVFERVVEQQIAGIDKELSQLKAEAERLKKEIIELGERMRRQLGDRKTSRVRLFPLFHGLKPAS